MSSCAAQRQAVCTDLAGGLAQDVPIWTSREGLTTVYFRDGTAGVLLTNDGVLLTDRIGRAAG
ncbi:hypothetical protein [Yinghuangia sp. YIM S09857]|uniref:hypothetical protein n=1 Tax=Yinghuangia sp. YIM S09857 TaxID=3436929 RepID=UPI003F52D4E8